MKPSAGDESGPPGYGTALKAAAASMRSTVPTRLCPPSRLLPAPQKLSHMVGADRISLVSTLRLAPTRLESRGAVLRHWPPFESGRKLPGPNLLLEWRNLTHDRGIQFRQCSFLAE